MDEHRRAMTAAALRTARASGARRACLDASDAGARVYLPLGFQLVAGTTRFFSGVHGTTAAVMLGTAALLLSGPE